VVVIGAIMPVQALPYIILQGFLFGSTLVVSRYCVGQFAPTIYIVLRLTIAGLAHILVYGLIRGRRLPTSRRLWKHAILLGTIGTAIPMTSIVASLQYQSSGITSLLLTANPALTVLLANFLLPDEPLTRRKASGVALALSGAVMLILMGENGLPDVVGASPIGYGLVMGAMVVASASAIYVRRFMSDMDSFDVASVRMWAAALAVMPLSVLIDGLDLSRVNGLGYGALVYAALVGTFIGLLMAFYIVKRFGATASAIPSYVIPIVATLGGMILLDETVTPGMIGGMAVIVAGIAILNQRGRPVPVPDSMSVERVLTGRR
jgi:drug/metabolite transporter (DMT)-like permease